MEPGKYSDWILERIANGEVFRLQEGSNTVGRTPASTIKVNSSFSSRSHCQFIVSPTGIVHLEDFSSNGTFVNNELHIKSTVRLADGDKIGIGCNVTDEEAVDDIYVMYMLRYRPSVTVPLDLDVLPERVKNPLTNKPGALHSDNTINNVIEET